MRKRKQITIEDKYEIIQSRLAGSTTKDLSTKFGLSSSTISTIFSEKDKYINEYETHHHDYQMKKRIRRSKFPELEDELNTWYQQEITLNSTTMIGGPEIKQKGLEIAEKLQITDFTGSSGWLQNFRLRFNITYRHNTLQGKGSKVEPLNTERDDLNTTDQEYENACAELGKTLEYKYIPVNEDNQNHQSELNNSRLPDIYDSYHDEILEAPVINTDDSVRKHIRALESILSESTQDEGPLIKMLSDFQQLYEETRVLPLD